MWIQDWIDYGGVRSNGQPVAHFEKLKEIHDTMDEMVYGDDGGLLIRFWPVPRRENREADALANMALDGCPLEAAHGPICWERVGKSNTR